jgi:hypothetical protein
MRVLQTVKKYMVPFLNKHGFKNVQVSKGTLIFEHETNPDLKIYFIIEKKLESQGITLEMRRGNQDLLTSYRLSLFLEEPLEMDSLCRDEYWYFDTEEELIGVLEEQANLLNTKAFDWMFRRSNLNIDSILTTRAAERETAYTTANEFMKKQLNDKSRKELDEWKARRVKPVNWE